MDTLAQIKSLVERNALFVVSHSGGKDSQAMLAIVRQHVPDRLIVVVHIDMHGMEWEGTWEHVLANNYGLPSYMVSKGYSLLDLVRKRHETLVSEGRIQSPWPSPKRRNCTSDLKRGPVQKFIRNYLAKHPEHKGLVVDCVGLRAEESSDRAAKHELELAPELVWSTKKQEWKKNPLRAAGREWWSWLPVHKLSTEEVFSVIDEAGQEPHYAYALGATRASCIFCIMASKADLRLGAQMMPQLYAEYIQVERETGFTMDMRRRGLEEVTGIRLMDLLKEAA